ncbi:MAG: S41 family peptidase [Myxococcota bacterium]|jgi:carboxyl-terminal processing protease|nr:S41 family peptidase [Myxococcota bacterium]
MPIHKPFAVASLCWGAAFLLLTFEASAASPSDHDIGRAEVTNRALLAVAESYYDPLRVDPKVMLQKALEELQRAVAELRLDWDAQGGKAKLLMPKESLELDVAGVDSPWTLARRMRDVYRLLQKNLSRQEYDFAELEYAAVNAMLMTLDPHSNALNPEQWDDLQTTMRGEFGGLGIKITTDRRPPCRGQLTVVSVIDATPAASAGFKAGDVILKIDGESTVNITTSEAASRLRGKPGTKVRLEVRRGESTKPYEVVRQTIPIESVKARLLADKVGLIELDGFQNNSLGEVQSALSKLHGQGMKSLVLDLRGNPGGSLDSVEKIADVFLDSGTIVVTAGRRREDREVANAQLGGTEPLYPIVLLADSGSASAAEILAGALRNHGRVLIVGETTFGKGSVQKPTPMRDGGAIKLTEAQYLLPGDVSIQAIGVPADVTFSPRLVDRKDMNLVPGTDRFSEADLASHLDRPTARRREVRDVLEGLVLVPGAEHAADMARIEKCYTDDSNDERGGYLRRYMLEFARRLAAKENGVTSEELRETAKQLLKQDNLSQSEAIEKALRALKVDWSQPREASSLSGEAKSSMVATASLRSPPSPGKELALEVRTRNGGKATAYRLMGVTKSDNPLLDGLELVLGKIPPGAKAKASAFVDVPALPSERVDPLTVTFTAASGPVPPPVTLDVTVSAPERSRLAYSWHVQELGEADGSFQPGEELAIYVTVKNVGTGSTIDAHVNLSAKPGIDIVQGSFSVGKLLPGRSASGQFRIRLAPGLRGEVAELDLAIVEWLKGRFPTELPLFQRTVSLPIGRKVPALAAARGFVAVSLAKEVPLREAPFDGAEIVAYGKPGVSYEVNARQGDFVRVRIADKRFAYLARSQTASAERARPSFDEAFIEPPSIRIDGSTVRRVKGQTLRISGVARHPTEVRDIIVFVGDRKVLYQANDGASGKNAISFNVDVPLEPGANRVVVIARKDKDVRESASVFVRRDDLPKPSK